MKILKSKPIPYSESVLPGIEIEIEIEYKRYKQAIIMINGCLKSKDGKLISYLNEKIPNNITKPAQERTYELWAEGTRFDKAMTNEIYKINLVAILNKETLNFIQTSRFSDKKLNVNLDLYLELYYIENKAVTYNFKDEENYIIRGPNCPGYMAIIKEILKNEIIIHLDEWIHDYVSKLGLGEFFIIEIPKGNRTIKEAWDYIENAEKSFENWDSKGVYANCREIGVFLNKLINKKYKNNPIIKKWKRAIKEFNFSTSLDLHNEDIKKEKPEGDIQINRAETEYILILSKGLIKYAEELLLEVD